MKCVKNLNTDEIKRVSNEHAERLADNKVWKFCPKSEWKALRIVPVVAVVHTDEQKQEAARKADKRKQANLKKGKGELKKGGK